MQSDVVKYNTNGVKTPLQSCRVWVVRQCKGQQQSHNNKGTEAVLMLHGQPCTIKMRDFSTDSDETLKLIRSACITRPQHARVRLGAWCQSTHSFDGGEFCGPVH